MSRFQEFWNGSFGPKTPADPVADPVAAPSPNYVVAPGVPPAPVVAPDPATKKSGWASFKEALRI